jgi:hypothetical protein
MVAGGLSHSSKTGSDWFLSKSVSVDGSLFHLLKQYSMTTDQGKMKRKKTGKNRTAMHAKHNR